MSAYNIPSYSDWLRGWREWARTRKRGRMAQFIVDKLEERKQAQWIDITKGTFELTEWHVIAKEWFGEKPRNSEEVDAPCMLRKGLPRAFPGLEELKDQSRKEGTQYRSRVFQASQPLIQEVLLHITNRAPLPGVPPFSRETDYQPNPGPFVPQQMDPSYMSYPSPTGRHSVKLEVPPNSAGLGQFSPPSTYPNVAAAGDGYLQQQQYSPNSLDSIDQISFMIATGGSGQGGGNNNPQGYATSNGWCQTPPSSVGGAMLQIPPTSPGNVFVVEDMANSPAGNHHSHYSPSSTHSPRISPEPTFSHPGSVSDMSTQPPPPPPPGAGAPLDLVHSPGSTASPAVLSTSISQIEEGMEPNIDLMRIKVLPNQSPLEGGGQMALIFYQPLPPGNKVVVYMSKINPNYAIAQQAFEENNMALVCSIPKYPIAEECFVRVFNDNALLAMTTFTFYQLQNPDMMLHLLGNQLQGYFTPMSQSGQGTMGASSGAQQGGMGGNYSGYAPSSMYQLLLGACNLGSEPLVHCLLSSPAMSKITTSELQEAYECAARHGHSNLAECLQEMVYCNDMTVSGYTPRGVDDKDSPPKHVPAYYEALDYLDKGGDSPNEQANNVFQQLVAAYKESKRNHDEEATPTNEAARPLYPTLQVESEQSVETTRQKLGGLSMDDSPGRRISRTLQHQQSISDEDESVTSLECPPLAQSRQSLAEQGDEVMPLWDPSRQSQSQRKKGKFSQQCSDADSAIGMSFEEDHQLLSEIQRRRSSAIADSIGSANNTISMKLTPEAGLEVANSLEWESSIIVTEDYPPSPDAPKIFYRGDRIYQVGDRLTRNMTVKHFAELFQSEAEKGTVLGIIPANMDKLTSTAVSETSKEPSLISSKSLYRSSSEQSLYSYESIKGKISVLLGIRPSSAQRKVTIPRTHLGLGLKLIGGKTVGVFVSDVKPEVTQVFPGDQVLEINGRNTQGMTLFDASSLLTASTSDLNLTVVENKGKFMSVREQVELDSLYLRSLVDHSPTSSRDMHLHKGSLVRVVNTFVYAPNYWLAWLVDEQTGVETQLKRILSPAIAKKQLGKDAYERVERSDVMFQRPVCLFGPDSSAISKELSRKSGFLLCSNVEEVLEACARGSSHPVISLSDPKQLALLTALQPIVFQTQQSLGKEQTRFNKMNISAVLTSDRQSIQADEAERHVLKQQALPVWKQVGVVH